MAAPAKVKKVDELKSLLAESKDFVLTTYSGLTVEQISDLRRQMREKNASLRVVKNNLFQLALEQTESHKGVAPEIAGALKGPVAVAFAEADLPAVSKVLVEYSKKNDKVSIKAGCLEGSFLDKSGVEGIANLPSKEELLAIIGRGLNTPATKIATGINQIMAALARGIKQVGEKNGD